MDPERAAACMGAAGIELPDEGEPAEESDGSVDGEVNKAHGLDNAIEHVLANCVKNPQAPGLLVALQRLIDNRERHEQHRAWLEERRAEREAAKAERKADTLADTPGHGKGHGDDGGHGKPHGGGSGGSDGGGHGQGGGSQGNGHH